MKKIKILILISAIFMMGGFFSAPTFAYQEGERDTSFNIWSAFNGAVNALVIQSDGKIIAGGNFTTYSWVSSNYIIRLNSDWLQDTGFNMWSAFNGAIYSLAIQSGGKILVGGSFTSYNWSSANRIIRLNADWTIDNTFNMWAWFDNIITALAIQSDGKIIVGGDFTSYNWSLVNRIVRLDSGWNIDNTFNIWAWCDFPVNVFAIQGDGKIIVGWDFTSYNWSPVDKIVRLDSGWSIDNTFTIWTGIDYPIYNLVLQSDGKIIAGGGFTSYNWSLVNRIARLDSSWNIDTSFNIWDGFDGVVIGTTLQNNGKIIAVGKFSTYNWSGTRRIARLNSDWSIDTGFNVWNGFNRNAFVLAIQSDGKIVVGWYFTTYSWASAPYIIRLNGTEVVSSSILSYIIWWPERTNVALQNYEYWASRKSFITIWNSYTFVLNFINNLWRTATSQDALDTPFHFKYRDWVIGSGGTGTATYKVKFFNAP